MVASACAYSSARLLHNCSIAARGSSPCRSGRIMRDLTSRASAPAGEICRWMIRPGGRRSAITPELVTHPPPGASTIGGAAASSRVSATSRSRKAGSPLAAKKRATDVPWRFSISWSKSRNGRSRHRATARPTVDFPHPGSPTSTKCPSICSLSDELTPPARRDAPDTHPCFSAPPPASRPRTSREARPPE